MTEKKSEGERILGEMKGKYKSEWQRTKKKKEKRKNAIKILCNNSKKSIGGGQILSH